MFANALRERMAAFVLGIGIDLPAGRLPADTLLPSLGIQHGAIVVDEERLAYPGDLLHEAGHIDLAEAAGRHQATLSPTPGEEIGTPAWSYAVLRMLDLVPEVVFHPHRYRDGAQALIDTFTGGDKPGVPPRAASNAIPECCAGCAERRALSRY